MLIAASSLMKLTRQKLPFRRPRCCEKNGVGLEGIPCHPAEEKVINCLSHQCKIFSNSFVLMAVSGGIDSMAMLHIMQSVSKRIPLSLEVVTFNHKLRPEADEEVSEYILLTSFVR
jgi:asparagine synthetase B (glutamine-hydrolysing)